MRKLLFLLSVALLSLGCSKDDPYQESFFIGTWEIVGVRSGNEPVSVLKPAQSLEHGTIQFTRRKDKAKRGSYDYKFTEENGTLQAHQGEFIWWMQAGNGDERYMQVNMAEFGQKAFGVGETEFGYHPSIEVVDNNRILFLVRLNGSTPRPHKAYEFELRRE